MSIKMGMGMELLSNQDLSDRLDFFVKLPLKSSIF